MQWFNIFCFQAVMLEHGPVPEFKAWMSNNIHIKLREIITPFPYKYHPNGKAVAQSWSTLVQVMASCLTAPGHCLNQCWVAINKALWYSHECNVIGSKINKTLSKFVHLKLQPKFPGPMRYLIAGEWRIYASLVQATRQQAIIRTSGGVLLIGPLGTNFNETISAVRSNTRAFLCNERGRIFAAILW